MSVARDQTLWQDCTPREPCCCVLVLRDKDSDRLWYRFLIQTRGSRDQLRLLKYMHSCGIAANSLLRPHQLLHRLVGLNSAGFPVSEALTKSLVSIPLYPALTDIEVRRVCD